MFREFLQESSIHGLRLLLYYTSFKYARLIWIMFMVFLIIWTHYIIASLTIVYIRQPTEIHLTNDVVDISKTNFPGVAICSANKFSRAKLLRFAEEVFEKQQIYEPNLVAQTVEEMAQQLLILKGFYIFAYDTQPLNATVIDGLDKIFTFMFNSTNYPIRHLLIDLAPDCHSLVMAGTIYGTAINTSEYFIKRMTSSSVCCLFNYNRNVYSVDRELRQVKTVFVNKGKKIKVQSSSIFNAVQFVMQSTPDDFTVTEFETTAFQLYIFPPDDYATIQSNRFGELLVDYNTIVAIPIKPQYLTASERVRQFPPNVRNCYFKDEGQKLLNQSFYSLDECLLLCRMQSMLKHCGCVSSPMAGSILGDSQCNFADLPCLIKWKGIWYGWDDYEYVNENGKNIKYDFTSSRRCPSCLPSCNGVNYYLETSVKKLRSSFHPLYSCGILKGLNRTRPSTVVELFFKSRYILSTRMDITGNWVVLLNRFGGIMSLMYGFSIVSYIEILYFATGKFFIVYFERLKYNLEHKLAKFQNTRNKKEEDLPPPYSLYWKELVPQRLVNNNLLTNIYKRHEI